MGVLMMPGTRIEEAARLASKAALRDDSFGYDIRSAKALESWLSHFPPQMEKDEKIAEAAANWARGLAVDAKALAASQWLAAHCRRREATRESLRDSATRAHVLFEMSGNEISNVMRKVARESGRLSLSDEGWDEISFLSLSPSIQKEEWEKGGSLARAVKLAEASWVLWGDLSAGVAKDMMRRLAEAQKKDKGVEAVELAIQGGVAEKRIIRLIDAAGRAGFTREDFVRSEDEPSAADSAAALLKDRLVCKLEELGVFARSEIVSKMNSSDLSKAMAIAESSEMKSVARASQNERRRKL